MRQRRRNAVVAGPAIHLRIRIPLQIARHHIPAPVPVDTRVDAAQRRRRLPSRVVKARPLPARVLAQTRLPPDSRNEHRRRIHFFPCRNDLHRQRRSAMPFDRDLVSRAPKLIRYGANHNEGVCLRLRVAIGAGHQFPVDERVNVVGSRNIQRRLPRNFLKLKARSEVSGSRFVSLIRSAGRHRQPDELFRQGRMNARFEDRLRDSGGGSACSTAVVTCAIIFCSSRDDANRALAVNAISASTKSRNESTSAVPFFLRAPPVGHPPEKTFDARAFAPHQGEEFPRVKVSGLLAIEGFETPLNVWRLPRTQAVTLRRDPVVAQRVEHGCGRKPTTARPLPIPNQIGWFAAYADATGAIGWKLDTG